MISTVCRKPSARAGSWTAPARWARISPGWRGRSPAWRNERRGSSRCSDSGGNLAMAANLSALVPRESGWVDRLFTQQNFSPEYQELKFILHRKLLDRINLEILSSVA